MIRITCTSCQKPLSIDETKLPMKEVSFPCPSCKTKLKIDRRKLAAGPAPVAEPIAAPAEESSEEELGEKAMIIGSDLPQIRQALKSMGRQPVHFATSDAARDSFLQDYPSLVIFCAPQVGAPPVADMAPLLQLMPVDRRKSYFVLVADNLRTLDGNAAFLYNVNLVVATKDLGSFANIFRDAMAFHERLYLNVSAFS